MICLNEKELKRASEDGFVIISRPDSTKGGFNVMACRIEPGTAATVVGWPMHVDNKLEIAEAATSIQRDLDKFIGVGGKMSSAGRLRPGIKKCHA